MGEKVSELHINYELLRYQFPTLNGLESVFLAKKEGFRMAATQNKLQMLPMETIGSLLLILTVLKVQ